MPGSPGYGQYWRKTVRVTRPVHVVTVLVVLSMLITPLAALPIPEDGIAGTLEDYTLVTTGLPTTGEFLFCTVGDVNGDGFDDIAAAASNNSRGSDVLGLRVYTCKGGTSWEDNSSGLPTVDRYGGIGLGDVDEDGDLDLVAGIEFNEGSSDSGITIWINNGTVGGKLSWIEGVQPTTSSKWMMVIFADINDDDHLDVVAGAHARGIKVWTGNGGAGGTLRFTEMSTGLPSNGDYTGIDVADMNNDDDMDIVACDYGGGIEAHLYTGDGAGNWTGHDSSFPSGSEATMGITTGDVDKDGNRDIIYGRRNNAVKCLLGNGGGVDGSSFCWTAADTGLGTSNRYSAVALADVDIDGDLDLLAACAGLGLQLYSGNGGVGGSMTWTLESVGLPSSEHYYGAAFGDFNKDTVLDVFGSLYYRRGVGGLVAYKGTVTGAAVPTAWAVWNGTGVNETSTILGSTVVMDGRNSFDAEDAPDGDVTGANLTYDWNLTAKPSGSSLTDADLDPDDADADPMFTPDALGNYTFTLSAQDSDLQWSLDQAYLELEVLPPNVPPVADAGEDQTVLIGSPVELNGTASFDTDGTITEWLWNVSAGNPVTIHMDGANTSVANFTAPDATGVYSFTLVVKDDNETWSLEDEVNVTVELPPNVVPFAIVRATPAIELGDVIDLNGSASYDPDGDIVEWQWNCTSNASLVIIGADGPLASATPGEAGTYIFTLKVRDDRGDWSLDTSASVLVVQPDVNLPPVAVITGAPSMDWVVNDTATIYGDGSYDEDGVLISYLWNCTSHPGLAFDGQNTTSISFLPIEGGDYLFTLAVMDDNLSWSLQEASITVMVRVPPPPPPPPPNQPPVAVIDGPSEPVINGASVYLSATDSYDPDGEIVDYDWRCTSHPELEMGGLNTSLIGFDGDEPGEYVITLRVMDNNTTWSQAVDFNVIVIEENLPPNLIVLLPASAILDLSETGGMLRVDWSAWDPNDDELVITIRVFHGFDIIIEKAGIDDMAVSQNFLLEWPLVENGTLLKVWVYAEEVDTQDKYSVSNTSVEFAVIGVEGVDEPDPDPEPDEEEIKSSPIVWVIAILVIAIVLILVIYLLTRTREGAYQIPPSGEEGAAPPGLVRMRCPDCDGPVDTTNAFGQPYCPSCDKYL